MRVVLSLGGSILLSEFSHNSFSRYAKVLIEIARDHSLLVVTGGGSIARDYINVARDLGGSEAVSDLIGIEVTRLNARLLILSLGENAYPVPPEGYSESAQALLTGRIVVMGGVSPGHTTDAVSAILAEYVNADMLINATAVDGVFTSDPNLYSDAEMIQEMTSTELVGMINEIENKAGAKAAFDLLGAKVIQRCGIPLLVINGTDPQNILRAVKREKVGTRVF